MTRLFASSTNASALYHEPEPDYAAELAHQIRLIGLSEPRREFKFHERRKWRADLAWPELKVLVEIEGGVWSHGRHTRGQGFLNDMEKYNEATLLGYALYRVTPEQVMNGQALNLIERIFRG